MNIEMQQKIRMIKQQEFEIGECEKAILFRRKTIKELSPVSHLDAKQIIAELDERRARLAVASKPVSERINYDAPGILIPFQE
jgi:hypothetical protein